MKLAREEWIAEGTVRLFDELFSLPDIKKHYAALAFANSKAWHVDEDQREDIHLDGSYAFLQADLDPEDFRRTELGAKLHDIACQFYEIAEVPERVFTMCFRYGDIDYLHTDYFSSGAGISLVYYPNPEWEPDWGGETIFFESEEASICVGVRPGRLALFPGLIPHRAGVPTRVCPKVRVSLNLRYNLRQAYD